MDRVATLKKCLTKTKLPKNIKNKFKPNSSRFKRLLKLKPSTKDTMNMYGKNIELPRFQQNYGKTYSYTGSGKTEKNIPKEFYELSKWTKNLSPKPFNQVLINWYMNGLDYIGKHSDSEKSIIPRSPIISISLGETRTFRIRWKTDNSIVEDISLKHGDVIIMEGEMQELYTHEIVKVQGKKGKLLESRINITFRQLNDSVQ